MSKRVINTANVAIPFDSEFTVEEFNDFLLKKASEAREKHSGLNAKAKAETEELLLYNKLKAKYEK